MWLGCHCGWAPLALNGLDELLQRTKRTPLLEELSPDSSAKSTSQHCSVQTANSAPHTDPAPFSRHHRPPTHPAPGSLIRIFSQPQVRRTPTHPCTHPPTHPPRAACQSPGDPSGQRGCAGSLHVARGRSMKFCGGGRGCIDVRGGLQKMWTPSFRHSFPMHLLTR